MISTKVILLLITLAQVTVILFNQTIIQKHIYRLSGFEARYRDLFYVNTTTYPLIAIFSYLVLPFQIFVTKRKLRISGGLATRIGAFEFISSMVAQILVITTISLFNRSFIRTTVTTLVDSMRSYLYIFLGIGFIFLLLRKKFRHLYRILDSQSKTEENFSDLGLSRLLKKPDRCISIFIVGILSLVPTFLDSILIIFTLGLNFSITQICKIFVVLILAYLIGILSQVPGGLGVREASAGILIGHELHLGLGVVTSAVSLIRIFKILSGIAIKFLHTLLLRCSDV